MKLTLALLATTFAAASAKGVTTNSKAGQNLLSKARKLDGGNDGEAPSWVADYAVKFVGCNSIMQWNEVDDDDESLISVQNLARFRLCPKNACGTSQTQGCSYNYGDYLVNMEDYLGTYLAAKQETEEAACEYVEANCDCDAYYDDESQQNCLAKCYSNANLSNCVQGDDEVEKIQALDYLGCVQWEPSNNDDNVDDNVEEEGDDAANGDERRRLEDANGNNYGYDEEEVAYYIGDYCDGQGGSPKLGIFTDETCSQPANSDYGRDIFYASEGYALPNSQSSMVESECWSCEAEAEEERRLEDANGNAYGYDEAVPNEACSAIYSTSLKCEDSVNHDYYTSTGSDSCAYIEGVRGASSNGIINSVGGGGNSVASAFIGIFSVSFVLLGSYVYYLKTKLDRGRINLSD